MIINGSEGEIPNGKIDTCSDVEGGQQLTRRYAQNVKKWIRRRCTKKAEVKTMFVQVLSTKLKGDQTQL